MDFDVLMKAHRDNLYRVLVLAFHVSEIWSMYIYQSILRETLSTKRFSTHYCGIHFRLLARGFIVAEQRSFDVIVDGIENCIIEARENLYPGSIYVNKVKFSQGFLPPMLISSPSFTLTVMPNVMSLGNQMRKDLVV
ncbi:hypothetical protein RJT34_12873 [Clitoria ternatea]|uniref:Uncharacterized protein n=1 Tax=Clitoria ternatea TaxID=43366 RepID=A0AAN9JPV1_CLITE